MILTSFALQQERKNHSRVLEDMYHVQLSDLLSEYFRVVESVDLYVNGHIEDEESFRRMLQNQFGSIELKASQLSRTVYAFEANKGDLYEWLRSFNLGNFHQNWENSFTDGKALQGKFVKTEKT